MRRLLSMVFCIVLCLASSAIALVNQEQIIQNNGETPVTVYSFENELPLILQPIVKSEVFLDAEILCGVTVSKEPDAYIMEDEPTTYGSIVSLLLIHEGGRLQLIGVSSVNDAAWHVVDFGDKLLRQGYTPVIEIMWVRHSTRPVFAVSYSRQNQHVVDLFSFSGNRIWEMIGHLNEREELEIYTTQNGFSVIDSGHEYQYSRATGYWMEYMGSIDEFPMSIEICKKLDAQNSNSDMSVLYGYTMDGDFWLSPSRSSKSLGSYSCYVPFIYLNETRKNGSDRWLKIQMGSTVGWMRETDCCLGESLPQYPVPVGKTIQDSVLYGDSSATSEIKRIPHGTYFHILGETDNGLYHICVPQGELSWKIDMTGTYGYVQMDEVYCGGSLSELNSCE